MARTPVLGGFSLNLFGGGGVSESVFSIASQSKQNEAYLALVRVQTRWDAGEVSDADYLAAYETYANSFPEGSAERLNKESSLNKLRYTIERNVLVSKVNDGSKTLSDLLTFDQSKLDGLNTDSQEYRDRLDNVRTTQSQLLSEKADEVNTDYQNGKMTTAQLLTWYQDRLTDPLYANNPDLTKQVQDQVDTLKGRVIDERDAQMISDYQNGKITPTQFLNYATAARARYTAGTTAAKDWDQRIQQARDSAVETDLSFRYDLSQEWLSLSQFVQSNNAPSGGTSTSTSTRTILGADGKWHVVKSTTTKATAPTAAQQQAYAQRQIEVNAAKRRMHQIENKLAGLPGGYVTTNEMLSYYKHQRSQVAKGSREWYSIQQKIDSLQATKSSESVMSRQGIKISYGKGGGGTKASSGGGGGGGSNTAVASSSGIASLDQFMSGIAKVESGGRYDARNKTTGAYGKYQILPSNWASWARKAGLPAGAKPTPANQEKVAQDRFKHLYRKYNGDYAAMAAEWFAGAGGAAGGDSSRWGPRTRTYVAHVLSAAGGSYSPGRTTGGAAAAASGGSAASTTKGGKSSTTGPTLKVITGASYDQNVRRRLPPQVIDTTDAGLPTGLTSTQFGKVYNAIEAAYKDGSDAATVDLGNGTILHLFIGDDPTEKLTLMRELDDMRIELADTEAKAYRGTGSAATKSQAAITARMDSAQHELIALDMPQPHPDSSPDKAAPVAAAVRMADKLVTGIQNEVDAMNEALDRGDLTAAYLHQQAIVQLANGKTLSGAGTGTLVSIFEATQIAKQRITQIVTASGLSMDQILSGAGPAGTALKSDLERLDNLSTEIAQVSSGGDEAATILSNVLKYDANGQVIWSGTGPRAEVQLKDNQYKELQSDGTVKIKTATGSTLDPMTGKPTPNPGDKLVKVVLKTESGGTTDAYTSYSTGNVGYVVMPDGSRVKLTGKIVSVAVDSNGDGVKDSVSTYYENPMNPGKWSNSAIFYNAPQGTQVVFKGGTQEPAFQFDGGDGNVVTLQLDAATGTYQVWAQGQPNLMGQGGDAILLGSGLQNLQAQAYLDLWNRDLSHVSAADQAMASLNSPFIGFSLDDYKSITAASTRFSNQGYVNTFPDNANVSRATGMALPKANAILQQSNQRDAAFARALGQQQAADRQAEQAGVHQAKVNQQRRVVGLRPISSVKPPTQQQAQDQRAEDASVDQARLQRQQRVAHISPLPKPKPAPAPAPEKKKKKKKKRTTVAAPTPTTASAGYTQQRTGGF